MHLPDYNYIYILDTLKYMWFYTDLSIVHLYQILSITKDMWTSALSFL